MGEDAYFMDFGYGTITKLKLINETKCKIIRDFQNTISVRRIRRLKMPVCLYDLIFTNFSFLLSDYLCTDQIASGDRVCGPIDTGSPLTIEEDFLEDDRR